MNTTQSTTQDATRPQFVWPLPGTKVPNGHLAWARWTAYQTAHLSQIQSGGPMAAPVPPARSSAVRLLSHGTMHDALAHFVWPLPATTLPSGHLTWTQWLTVQAEGMGLQQSRQVAPERAA